MKKEDQRTSRESDLPSSTIDSKHGSFETQQDIMLSLRAQAQEEYMMEKRLQCAKMETAVDDDEGTNAIEVTNNDAPLCRQFLRGH